MVWWEVSKDMMKGCNSAVGVGRWVGSDTRMGQQESCPTVSCRRVHKLQGKWGKGATPQGLTECQYPLGYAGGSKQASVMGLHLSALLWGKTSCLRGALVADRTSHIFFFFLPHTFLNEENSNFNARCSVALVTLSWVVTLDHNFCCLPSLNLINHQKAICGTFYRKQM